MASKIAIRKADSRDAAHLGEHMRLADRQEIWASHRITAPAVARLCVERYDAWCVDIDGEAAVFFGCSEQHGVGVPWMLATDAITKIGVRFLLGSKPIVEEWQRQYGLLTNYVHAGNEVSRRWLTWLGFSLKESITINNERFYRFERRSDPHV